MALAQLYQMRLDCREPSDLFDFSFAQDNPGLAATVKVARMPLNVAGESSLWAIASLGTGRIVQDTPEPHEHQFVGIYDSESLELCEFIAALYHFDLRVEAVGDGHTVPLGKGSNLRGAGFSAGLVLRGEYYAPFAEPIPHLEGVRTSLLSVMIITEGEVRFKKDHGLPALLQRWKQEGRDRFTVRDVTSH
jgi:hypothetical protein